MAYVMAFAFSMYSTTLNRTGKPFNPLLGETFEFVDETKGFSLYFFFFLPLHAKKINVKKIIKLCRL